MTSFYKTRIGICCSCLLIMFVTSWFKVYHILLFDYTPDIISDTSLPFEQWKCHYDYRKECEDRRNECFNESYSDGSFFTLSYFVSDNLLCTWERKHFCNKFPSPDCFTPEERLAVMSRESFSSLQEKLSLIWLFMAMGLVSLSIAQYIIETRTNRVGRFAYRFFLLMFNTLNCCIWFFGLRYTVAEGQPLFDLLTVLMEYSFVTMLWLTCKRGVNGVWESCLSNCFGLNNGDLSQTIKLHSS